MKKVFLLLYTLLIVQLSFGQQKDIYFLDNANFELSSVNLLNVEASDISPFFVDDSLYFTSVPDKYSDSKRRDRKNKAFYSMYCADLNAYGKLESRRKKLPGFGHAYHEGPSSYCESTGELFVTLSNTSHPDSVQRIIPKLDIKLHLGIMQKTKGVWKLVENLPFCDKRFHYAHPAINASGDTLIFSSDIDSLTYGSSDLFISVRKSGVWSAPKNLGSNINTEGEESFPSFLEDGLLSFSSDSREGGYGGLDIYYADFPKFNRIINLGGEVNSESDDFALSIHKNRRIGYFSSNRSIESGDDLYQLNIIPMFKGLVVDHYTNLPIPNANLTLYDCDNKVVNTLSSNEEGVFSTYLKNNNCPLVKASKLNYENAEKDITGLAYAEIRMKYNRQILVLDRNDETAISGASFSCEGNQLGISDALGLLLLTPPYPYDCELLISKKSYLNQGIRLEDNEARIDTVYLLKAEVGRSFIVKNIYYDFDKWDILPESKIELDKIVSIMIKNPGIKVEMSSHTDSRGTSAYNEKLSVKRSESIVAYMVSQGVSKERMVAKGYGEQFIINRCSEGVKCFGWEHRQNRRTEFKIIGLVYDF